MVVPATSVAFVARFVDSVVHVVMCCSNGHGFGVTDAAMMPFDLFVLLLEDCSCSSLPL